MLSCDGGVVIMITRLNSIGAHAAAALYESPDRGLFYRKSQNIKKYFETCRLPDYNGELLYPSGAIKDHLHYMSSIFVDFSCIQSKDAEAAETIREDFFKYHSSVPKEHTVAGNMYNHSMPNYERILKEGFDSYIPRIENIADEDVRDGLLLVLEGIRIYSGRCIEYLESKNADIKLINALKKVPFSPAENIYEAVAAWNFILYLDDCDNLGCVASGLLPYYNGEDITDLLTNMYDNLDINCGYSMALGVDYNPLTLQCLEASKGKRRPMIELFVNDETPDEVWSKAFEVIRTSNGQPAFYNEKVLLGGLKKKFPTISDADIKKFCGGGCTESMIAGLSNVGSLDAGINLLLILENCIYSVLPDCDTFEKFYDHYISEVRAAVEKVTHEISESQRRRAEFNPIPMRTLLTDDCIDKGVDYNSGGARYCWSIINFAGLINVIDSMLVMRDFVYASGKYTADELIRCLKSEDDHFMTKAREYSISFGNDNNDANSFSAKLSTDIFSMLDDKTPYLGDGFLPASIQFKSQAMAGRDIGATPDGRKNSAPLCDSLAAIFGKDMNGPTALLKSVTSLNLERMLGVPVLNFNINPSFSDDVLKSLIKSYMELGGIQMQITCTSAQTLKEAMDDPSMHRNLVVRVGGYSDYFCNLEDDLKLMIYNRTIQENI